MSSSPNNNKIKVTPSKKTDSLSVVSAFISAAVDPNSTPPALFSSPSVISLLSKSSKRSNGENKENNASDTNFAENSTSISEKRKRPDNFMGPTNTGAKTRKIEKMPLSARVLECKMPECGCGEDAIFDFFKKQVVAEKEAKVKLARMLNSRMNENALLTRTVSEILDTVTRGLECAETVVPRVVTNEDAQLKFNNSQEMLNFYPGIVDAQKDQINNAYKLRANHKMIDVLSITLNGVVTECDELRQKIAALNLPKPTVHQIVRSSTPTSSRPVNKLTAKKKKVLFSSPIDDRLQQSSSSKQTPNIEIPIPENQSTVPEFLLKGEIEKNIMKIENQLEKFKNINYKNEKLLDFATFNISQESEISSSNEIIPDSLPSFDSVPDVFPGIPTTTNVFQAKDGWTALPSPDRKVYEQQIRNYHRKNVKKDDDAPNNKN